MRSLALAAAILALCATPALCKGPLIDYDCARKCIKEKGWNPICVDDGRDKNEGTLYANECTWKKCVILGENPKPNSWYTYLPLDCGSRVACSLMGRAVDECKQLWLVQKGGNTPKTNEACGCGITVPKTPCKVGKGACTKCSNKRCSKCQGGFRVDKYDGVCKKCTVTGCKDCDGKSSYCHECKKGYKLVSSSKCVKA